MEAKILVQRNKNMSQFRISWGSASCNGRKKMNYLNQKICDLMKRELKNLSALGYNNLTKIDSSVSEHLLEDTKVTLAIYKKELIEMRLLMVVQASYRSLLFPNYISLRFVGKVFVDGFVVDKNENVTGPDDELLFEFK